MTQSKQPSADDTTPKTSNPFWLTKLSQILSNFDPGYAWTVYERWNQSLKDRGECEIGESEVVYCRDPMIVVNVKPGQWSLTCKFESTKKQSHRKPRRQRQVNRNKLER